MSDQHVVSDWAAFFASLGPGVRSPLSRDFGEMYKGFGQCSVTYVRGIGVESVEMPEGEELLPWAFAVWVREGHPEMWVFCNPSGPPWYVPRSS